MAATDLNIVLKLNDQLSNSLAKASTSLDKFGNTIKSFGKDLSQVGNQLAIFGGAITGPFLLAINNASKDSFELQLRLNRIKDTAQSLQVTIAQAVLPVIDRFINIIQSLHNRFQALDPEVRDNVLQMTLLVGVTLTAGGAVTALAGKIFGLVANLISLAAAFGKLIAINPVLFVILGAVIAIAVAMEGWERVGRNVMNFFQIMFISLKIGFLTIKSSVSAMISEMLDGIGTLALNMAQLGGPQQGFFEDLAVGAKEAAADLNHLATVDLVDAKNAAMELDQIFTTGTGSWAEGFTGLLDNIRSVIEELRNLGKNTEDVQMTTKQAMIAIGVSFKDMLSVAAKVSKDAARVLQAISIGEAIMHTAVAVTSALKQPFPWNLVLASILAAKGAAEVAVIRGQKFHTGGMIKGGLRNDEVPIVAQTGEGILSRRGMSALGGEQNLDRLNRGQVMAGGDTTVNIYIESPNITSNQDIDDLGERLGFRTMSALRTARGI